MKYHPKRNNAIAYLRQLCCSGLPKEVVIPEFLRAIKAVIPSGSNTFSGIDEQLQSAYHLTEFVTPDFDELTPTIIASFFAPQRLAHSANWFSQHPALVEPKLLDNLFYQSDLYNLVYRRYDQHHVLIAPVRQNGGPIGMLGLFRPRQQKPFDSHEQALCVQLLPYLAHACGGG